jgi:excinuclease ABC subunit B
LIQTIGRAARNADGMVVMYADTVTPSMQRAMDETARRREIQDAFNKEHGIVPKTVIKSVRDLLDISAQDEEDTAEKRGEVQSLTKQQKAEKIAKLEKEMRDAAKMLEFELAAALRDQIIELRGN